MKEESSGNELLNYTFMLIRQKCCKVFLTVSISEFKAWQSTLPGQNKYQELI